MRSWNICQIRDALKWGALPYEQRMMLAAADAMEIKPRDDVILMTADAFMMRSTPVLNLPQPPDLVAMVLAVSAEDTQEGHRARVQRIKELFQAGTGMTEILRYAVVTSMHA